MIIPWTLAVLTSMAATATPVQSPCPALAQMDVSQRLLLVRCIPIGAKPADVARFVPGFETSLYGGISTLYVGATRTEILGHQVALRFNFTADSLYAMFFDADLPAAEGDSLFDQVTAFYSKRYGPPRICDGQDDPYFIKDRQWCTDEYEVGASCSLAGDRRMVGWGFQTPTVACSRPSPPKRN